MLGASKPHVTAGGKSQTQVEHSQYIRDDILAPFPRYQALAANIRTRRKRKPAINIPVYRDRETPWPFSDPTVDYSLHLWPEDDDVRNGAVKENCVYLDSFIGGACCCSLQVTMQASNMDQARWLYDQLIPMGPIMLALTAATPIFKGYLTGVDVRWPQFAMASDERTAEEQDRGVYRIDLPDTF
jgi:glutamate--cysteine ligase catalytic subunit